MVEEGFDKGKQRRVWGMSAWVDVYRDSESENEWGPTKCEKRGSAGGRERIN